MGNFISMKSITNKNLGNFSRAYFIIFLTLLAGIYSYIYFPHAFIINEDITLINANDVDAGSIMTSILSLFDYPYYSMFNSYHSNYYGWTYYVVTFLFLIPVKTVNYLFFNSDPTIDYLTIRLVFFLIGLFYVLATFTLFNKISLNKERFFSFLLSLLLLLPFATNLFIQIHPETTGLLFLTLGILFLINFSRNYLNKSFNYSIFFLALASCAKQIFFIGSIPLLICFYTLLAKKKNLTFYKYLTNSESKKYFYRSAKIGILVFFAINPYVILHPIDFIMRQGQLMLGAQSGSISFYENINAWLNLIKGQTFLYISLIIVPINILSSFILYWKKDKTVNFYLNMANCFAILFILIMTIRGNNYLHSAHYLNPLSLFLYLNILSVGLFLINFSNKITAIIIRIFIYSFLVYYLIFQYSNVKVYLEERLDFKSTLPYITYEYIKNLTKDDPSLRIAHDHFIAPPSDLKFTCHYWNTCSGDLIYDFNPDYLIFNADWTYVGKPHIPTTRLKQYAIEKNMILIDKINNGAVIIYVYKKSTIN